MELTAYAVHLIVSTAKMVRQTAATDFGRVPTLKLVGPSFPYAYELVFDSAMRR